MVFNGALSGNVQSLPELITRQCSAFPDRVAFIEGAESLSYSALYEQSARLSGALRQVCGIAPGDRVAVILPNGLAFPICLAGVLGAGAVQVNVNPHYVAVEIRHQVEDAGARVIITSALSLPALLSAQPKRLERIILIDNAGYTGTKSGIPITPMAALVDGIAPMRFVERAKDAPAFLQYTGGTTGRAKGVMLSHGNILANIGQFSDWSEDLFAAPPLVALTAIPLYHIFALTVNLFSVLAQGGTNVLIRDPRDIGGLCAQWTQHRVNFVTGVNTLFNALTRSPSFAQIDFDKKLVALGGGAPVQAAVSERWRALTGNHIKEGYGLSETSPVVSCTPAGETRFIGSIGRPLRDTRIALRDVNGRDVAIGDVGEVCVSGPQVMQGYWNQPEATANAMTDDGYFRTGDLGRVDAEGCYYIVDRMKDMILVSGFNVYPNEVEDVVARLDGVLEAACVGMPHETTGECVLLFVVRCDPTVTERQIEQHCRTHLAAYKIPRNICFVDALPKSTVGKVLRRELQALAMRAPERA